MILWLNKLTNKLMGIYHKFPNTDYPVKYAFTVGGIDYYQFDDTFNLPYERAMKASAAYEEMRMKCTFEYLQWHTKVIDNLLKGAQGKGSVIVSLVELQKRNNQLKERLDKWIIDLRQVERLASIVYFDKSENPKIYDYKHANEKILHWRKHNAPEVFFSHLPIRKLVPFLDGFDLNFQIYSEVIKQMDKLDLENLSENLSEAQKKGFSEWQSDYFATETSQN